ncbi:hypothetical protein HPB51_029766 [Rhipicephalus microplus]|uniref:Polycomb-like MTF2 factor 2 C-terminal domain-containing protein n=1 Tax=Rhipicephalus microplus TaxID=6941 RepID=A0A9J6CTT9_RHIMP|nr:hypothetical protein HPB51_029766 [Rhipicephalus microplus]
MKRKGFSLRRRTGICRKLPEEYEEKLQSLQRFLLILRHNNGYLLGQIGNADQTPLYFDMPGTTTVEEKGAKQNNGCHSSKLSNGLGRSKARVHSVQISHDPFDCDEEAASSGTGEGSTFLDAFIPPLRDFHGGNHPFRDEVLFPPPPPPKPRPGRPPKKRTLPVPLKPVKLKLRGSQRRLIFGIGDTDSEDYSSTMSSTSTTSAGSATSSGIISSTSGTSSTASSRVDCSTQGRGSLRWKEMLRSSEAASSEKSSFTVLAKRISIDGKVQYLIDWDNCGSKT